LGKLLYDLKSGKNISIIVDSHIRSNYPQYLRLFRYLKHLGVKKIYDGSFGFELFSWAHLQYLEQYRPFSLITSHCPVVINYCRKHRQELLHRVSPIVGPLIAHYIYLKEFQGVTDSIGILGPCPAAFINTNHENQPDYIVTFKKLAEYIKTNQVNLELYDQEPQLSDSESHILPIHPTLKKIVKNYLDLNIRVDAAQGPEVLPLIDEYANTPVENLAPILDLLYCRHGCALGIGCSGDNTFFKAKKIQDEAKREFSTSDAMDHINKNFDYFNEYLYVELFMEKHISKFSTRETVTAEEMENSFLLLGKAPGPDRHFNCGYCGHATCREMAISIALKNNLPENCVTRMKLKSADLQSKSTTYLELIQNVSEYLLLNVTDDYNTNVEYALMALCYSMNAFSASLWKNFYNSEEQPVCQKIVSYPSKLINKNLQSVTLDDPRGWLDTLMDGNSIVRLKSNMSSSEQQKFLGRNVNTILLAPIIAQGDFWGFITIMKNEEKIFKNEDIAVISICSNILASSLINQNIQDSFIEENISLIKA
jgi:hypothetical protein